jgi:hypothetical protein
MAAAQLVREEVEEIVEEEIEEDVGGAAVRAESTEVRWTSTERSAEDATPASRFSISSSHAEDVDQTLVAYIEATAPALASRFERIGPGKYLVWDKTGSQKVFIKELNGKLIVRVGVGYMPIDAFLASQADA